MSDDFRVGAWLVQPSLNSISGDGSTTRVEPKVMAVLVCLASHSGKALTKEELLQEVWQDTFVTEDVLKHAISELRRVFEDDARDPHVIQTIPKRGYRLLASVQPMNGSNDVILPAFREPIQVPGQKQTYWWKAGLVIVVLLLLAVIVMFSSWWRRRVGSGKNLPEIRSLAVLPLQNLSGDPAQDYFSDGITDTLITDLAQVSGVKVISRTSVMHYKKTDKTLPEPAN